MEFAVIFEQGPTSIGAYVPDLPGCVAVGRTLAETRQLIHEAIALHLHGMAEDGEPVPAPVSSCVMLAVGGEPPCSWC